MLTINDVQGAIFDIDETLLAPGTDNHAQARLLATQELAKRHRITALDGLTREQLIQFFLDAPVHSAEGAVWHMLYTKGLVNSEVIEPDHPWLLQIIQRKNELYADLLRASGKPMPGAVAFVKWLAERCNGRVAVASTAIRRDIGLFLEEITDLITLFPEDRIISKEKVTHLKPHPEAFDKAFQSLALPDAARSQVLAFEDNPRGILSAKGAGLFTCCITTIYSRQDLAALDVPPDLIADSFAEFRRLLEGKPATPER